MVNQVGTLRTVLKMDYITQQMYGPLLSTASAKMGVKKQMIIVSWYICIHKDLTTSAKM